MRDFKHPPWCSLLWCYMAYVGSCLLIFQTVYQCHLQESGSPRIGSPETSVNNYQYMLRIFRDEQRPPCMYIYGSFTETFSSSDYIGNFHWWDDQRIVNWTWFKRKQSWYNWTHYHSLCLDRLRKTTENLSECSCFLGWDSKTRPPTHYGTIQTSLKVTVFWNVTPCCLVDGYQIVGGTERFSCFLVSTNKWHCITSCKKEIFRVTSLKTSNLTKPNHYEIRVGWGNHNVQQDFYFNSSQWSEANEEGTFQPLVWTEFILHGHDII